MTDLPHDRGWLAHYIATLSILQLYNSLYVNLTFDSIRSRNGGYSVLCLRTYCSFFWFLLPRVPTQNFQNIVVSYEDWWLSPLRFESLALTEPSALIGKFPTYRPRAPSLSQHQLRFSLTLASHRATLPIRLFVGAVVFCVTLVYYNSLRKNLDTVHYTNSRLRKMLNPFTSFQHFS